MNCMFQWIWKTSRQYLRNWSVSQLLQRLCCRVDVSQTQNSRSNSNPNQRKSIHKKSRVVAERWVYALQWCAVCLSFESRETERQILSTIDLTINSLSLSSGLTKTDSTAQPSDRRMRFPTQNDNRLTDRHRLRAQSLSFWVNTYQFYRIYCLTDGSVFWRDGWLSSALSPSTNSLVDFLNRNTTYYFTVDWIFFNNNDVNKLYWPGIQWYFTSSLK